MEIVVVLWTTDVLLMLSITTALLMVVTLGRPAVKLVVVLRRKAKKS